MRLGQIFINAYTNICTSFCFFSKHTHAQEARNIPFIGERLADKVSQQLKSSHLLALVPGHS